MKHEFLDTYTEFYRYNNNTAQTTSQTLVFDNPCFISFLVTGPTGSTMYLNNVYKMAYIQPAGLSQNNSLQNYLAITCPANSIDKTVYTIQLLPQTSVQIVVRFYNKKN